jgi:outer membrane lipoprotein-sorting protein
MNQNLSDPGDEVLESYFSAMRGRAVPDGPPETRISETIAALRAAAGKKPGVFSRVYTMKFITGMAASVLLVVGVVLVSMVMLRSPEVTFGEIVERVRSAHLVSFVETVSMPEVAKTVPGQTMKMKFLINDQGQASIQSDEGVRTVMDEKTGHMVELMPKTKTAIVMDMKNMPKQSNASRDPLEQFKKLEGDSANDMGRAQIDGKKAQKFNAKVMGQEWMIWADPQTREPIRIDMTMNMMGQQITASLTDFDFDPAAPDDAFSQEIPKGYTITSLAFDLPDISNREQNLVELLRGYAQRAGGKFPDKLDDMGPYMNLVMRKSLSLSKTATTNPSLAWMHFTPSSADMQWITRFWGVQQFLGILPKDGWKYLGAGKTMGDSDSVIFWYKTDKGYRGISGNLTAADLQAAPQ